MQFISYLFDNNNNNDDDYYYFTLDYVCSFGYT